MPRKRRNPTHADSARAEPGGEGLQRMQPRDRGDGGAAGLRRLRVGLTVQVHERAPQDGTSSALHVAGRGVEGAACQILHKVTPREAGGVMNPFEVQRSMYHKSYLQYWLLVG